MILGGGVGEISRDLRVHVVLGSTGLVQYCTVPGMLRVQLTEAMDEVLEVLQDPCAKWGEQVRGMG